MPRQRLSAKSDSVGRSARATPNLGIVEASEGLGIDQPTGALVRKALAANPDIVGAYSIGGEIARWSRRSARRGGGVACSSSTISTLTILHCFANRRSQRCCITTCEPICARPVAS
jgi:hypothetical protein